jgi:hypothetical protein
MSSTVTRTPAASTEMALAHFARRISFETDCWDVHEPLASGQPDFVLFDVRSPGCSPRVTFSARPIFRIA